MCGAEFERKYFSQKHCSDKCRIKWSYSRRAKDNIKTYTCEWCGLLFDSDRKRKFCSDKCRLIAYKKRKSKNDNGLDQITKLAREAGLSYGQYVNKMGL